MLKYRLNPSKLPFFYKATRTDTRLAPVNTSGLPQIGHSTRLRSTRYYHLLTSTSASTTGDEYNAIHRLRLHSQRTLTANEFGNGLRRFPFYSYLDLNSVPSNLTSIKSRLLLVD
jgi:hypothetical protein